MRGQAAAAPAVVPAVAATAVADRPVARAVPRAPATPERVTTTPQARARRQTSAEGQRRGRGPCAPGGRVVLLDFGFGHARSGIHRALVSGGATCVSSRTPIPRGPSPVNGRSGATVPVWTPPTSVPKRYDTPRGGKS